MTQPANGSDNLGDRTPTFVRDVVDRFEDAWQQGGPPELARFLPAEPDRRGAVLLELAAIDLEYRLKRGEPARVEHYVAAHPELADVPGAVPDLLAVEYELRRRREPGLDAEDYLRRFPQYAAEFQARLLGPTPAPPARSPADTIVGGPTGTAADAGPGPGTAGPRFRPLRFHAEGGLGEVLVAEDAELHREVALKRIRPGRRDDPESRRRFLLEAEITGRLEHPGVVPVYSLGQDGDGQPCYAMRFIGGETMQEAIRRFHEADRPGRDPGERRLAFRHLLGAFVTVCNTVAYAHGRGVIHRDLKPANVMLGQYGETLVVDWGLAKPFQQGAALPEAAALTPVTASRAESTAVGEVVGTPAYMSPEQAAGRTDLLGPAADVYSLGATLYALLTGQPPCTGPELNVVLDAVQRGSFPSPRQLRPWVPPALEAICLKAMALRPEDRYASALTLAGEVEHWLADEPVAAYREPLPARAGRWARRHPALVAGATATALVASLLGGAGAWWFDQQRREADELRGRATAGETLANHRLEEVTQQKQRTEEEAAIARAVIDFLQGDLIGQADIANQPLLAGGPGRSRDLPVSVLFDRAGKAIEGKFADQPLTEAAIRRTLGNAYRGLGRLDEAERHLERSVDLRSARLGPDHLDTLVSKNDLAVAYKEHGKLDRAEPLYEVVLAARTARLGENDPAVLGVKNNLAELYHSQGKYERAEPLYQAVVAGLTAQVGPDCPQTLTARNNLALLYLDQAKYDLAEPLFQEVIAGLTAKLGADHPETLGSMSDLAVLYKRQGRFGPAQALCEEVLAVRTVKLGADHPDTLTSKNSLASLHQAQGKFDQAETLYQEVLAACKLKLGADHPDTLTCQNNLANLYRAQRRFDRAEPLLQEILAARTAKLGADHPDTLTSKHTLGSLYSDMGKYELAEKLLKEVIVAQTAKLGEDHPHNLASKHNLAAVYWRTRRFNESVPLFEDLLRAHRHKLGDDHPDTISVAYSLAVNYRDAGRLAEAERTLDEWLPRGRAQFGPGHRRMQLGVETALDVYGRSGKLAKVEPLLRDLADLAKQQAGADSAAYGGRLAVVGANLVLQQKGAEAESVLRDSLTILRQKAPDAWTTFQAQSLLGAALVLQQRYAEAEPLLIQGYEEMKQKAPATARPRLAEALERLVRLYDAWDKPESADARRKELQEARAAAPLP